MTNEPDRSWGEGQVDHNNQSVHSKESAQAGVMKGDPSPSRFGMGMQAHHPGRSETLQSTSRLKERSQGFVNKACVEYHVPGQFRQAS